MALALLAAAAWWWMRTTPHADTASDADMALPGGSAASPAGARPRRVLLVTVDTLRADAVGAYGRTEAQTPWMDRLAAGGVRFDRARAHNVVTLPSHANILSGRYPFEHGIRDNAGFRFPDAPTLATLLAARGFKTGAFVSAFPLDSRFGLRRGFEVYDDAFVGSGGGRAFLVQERPGTETVARARRWLDAQGDAPAFCWVHLYEPHFPYAPPEPMASRFRASPYDGEVAAADIALGPLLAPILAAGESGRTLVVVTSDHGESLGEHGEATHGIFGYEASLRVPLIVYHPGSVAAGVSSAPAHHVDILPTVLDALAIQAPGDLPGRSLLRDGRGQAVPSEPTYFEAMSGAMNRGWAPLRGLVRDELKFVDLPIPELYDLRADPRETRNLAAEQPARLEALRAELARMPTAAPAGAWRRESAETRERLQSLGYIGTGSVAPKGVYTQADDPKRLIELDELLQDVVGRYLEGDLAGALAQCRELVRRRPDMAVALLNLAQLERETGNIAAGVAALERAAALDAHDTQVVALLGAYLTEAGRARDAVDRLQPFTAGDDADVDVLAAYALALARLGRFDEAVSTLTRARRIDPAHAMLHVHQGTVHLMANERARAREAFQTALSISPDVARAHSSLGVLAAEDGRLDDARAHWMKAAAIDPREYRTILGVGLSLAGRGRHADARPFLEHFAANAPPSMYAQQLEVVAGLLAGQDDTNRTKGTKGSKPGAQPR